MKKQRVSETFVLLCITIVLLLIYSHYDILNWWTGGFTFFGAFLIAGNIWDPDRKNKENE